MQLEELIFRGRKGLEFLFTQCSRAEGMGRLCTAAGKLLPACCQSGSTHSASLKRLGA